MRNYVFISEAGDGLPLAWRLMILGHDVKVYVWDKLSKKVDLYGGILDIKWGLPAIYDKSAIYIFDMSGQGKLATKLIKQGYSVIGAHDICDRLEKDRNFSLQIAQSLNFKMPPSYSFKSYEDYMSKKDQISEGKYVIKPNNLDVQTTTICDSVEELNQTVEELNQDYDLKEFIVQQFIDGIELSTEMWFSHGKPVLPLNSTFEDKRLLAGDIGPNTGCAGSIVFGYQSDTPRLYKALFKQFEKFISLFDYTGPVDINTIISYKDNQAYFLEFTPRFGYNAIYAFSMLLDETLDYFFESLVEGKQRMKLKSGVVSCIHAYVIPMPANPVVYDNGKITNIARDIPIHIDRKFISNIFMPDIYYNGQSIVTAGNAGTIGHIAAVSDTIENANKEVYAIIDTLRVPDICYRNDIGHRIDTKVVDFLNKNWYDIPVKI